MDYIEFDTLGRYFPTFLRLHLHSFEPLKDIISFKNNPDHKELYSTFLHEYIHFLQDISTPFGLTRAILLIESLREFIVPIRKSAEIEFTVPIEKSNLFNAITNVKLQELYDGDKDEYVPKIIYRGYFLETVAVKDRDENVMQVAQYSIIYFDLDKHVEKSFVMGVICLKEYMTHAIQSRYIQDLNHADIPYLIVELICRKEHLPIASDPMLMVALCDACMYSAHPVQFFFKTLERMRDQDFKAKHYLDILLFAFSGVRLDGPQGEFHPIEFYEHTLTNLLKRYSEIFSSDLFMANRVWLNHIFRSVHDLRQHLPEFMMYLVGQDGNVQKDFDMILQALGTPFLTNDNEDYGFVKPASLNELNIMPYQMLALAAVYDVLKGGTKCILHNFCRHRPDKDITNDHCETAPWERTEEELLCPFAQLWISWGLRGKIPVKK